MVNWTIMVYISADNVLANFAVESLKQLKRSAGKGIVVVAQVDANERRGIHRYRFDGTGDCNSSIENDNCNSSIESDKVDLASPASGIANPKTLREFITWASESPESKAKHYCLFLWGHGYELLLDEDPPSKHDIRTARLGRRYLTPANLKESLRDTPLTMANNKLDIIGIDACSMSLVEVASELEDSVEFMIASQGEVPDASFPYERLLLRLRDHDPNDVPGICEAVPGLYKQAYQDYVVAPSAGMAEITLSSLRLGRMDAITDPLKGLAKVLLSSTSDRDVRSAVIDARRRSRDFALGLFVDLFDFCSKLKEETLNNELKSACANVCDAIARRGEESCVIENQTGEGQASRCHGLSVYFPYLADGEDKRARDSLKAGRTDLVDQLPLLVKGGTDILRKARLGRIGELEEDFKLLDRFGETKWYEFIAHGWSYILTKEVPEELDLRYSAQQCAMNLLSRSEEKRTVVVANAA